MTRAAQVAVLIVFGALLAATTLFLWNAHRLGLPEQLASAAGLIALLCVVGWLSDRTAAANPSVFSR